MTWLYAVQLGQLSSVELCRYKHPLRDGITIHVYDVTCKYSDTENTHNSALLFLFIYCVWLAQGLPLAKSGPALL